MLDVEFQLKGSAITLVVLAISRYNAKDLRDAINMNVFRLLGFV